MTDALRVGIVGLGAIGGSIALRLVERGAPPQAWASDADDRSAAAAAGVLVTDSLAAAVLDRDVVMIAVPLGALPHVVADVIAAASPRTTILHASGLQRFDALGLTEAQHARIIGTHPLAGSARGGFAAAHAGMFGGATVLIEPRGARPHRQDAERFWTWIGAEIVLLDAKEHDDRVAVVSHIPQLVATALAAALSASGEPAAALGPGGRDMTRLAQSGWEVWGPLLAATPERTREVLAAIEQQLADFRESLEAGDVARIESAWTAASRWRAQIERT